MILNNTQQQEIGKQIIELLNLKVDAKTGYVKTSTGTKSALGLYRTIKNFVDDYWALMNINKQEATKVELAISATPFTSFLTFAEANKWFRNALDQKSFSDMTYRITYGNGKGEETLEGVIDCEPREFFHHIQNPLSWHLDTYWNNCANHNIERDGYKGLDQQAVDHCKDIVSKYMFTDK